MVKVEKIDSVNFLVSAHVGSEELEKEEEKVAKKIAKTAKVQGFRPGKVPIQVVKRLYAHSIQEESLNNILNDILDKAIKELNITPIGAPIFNKLNKDKDLDVEFKISTMPAIELEDKYLKCVPTPEVEDVSEEEIEKELKNIAQMFSTTKVSDKKTLQKGDIAIIDFKGYIDNKPLKDAQAEAFALEIGSGSFVEGFEDSLIGMQVGESKKIKVTFPKNYHQKELAQKEAEFDVTLQEIQEKIPAEINDELAKKYLNKDNATLDDLKEHIKKMLKDSKKQKAFEPLKEQILECLLKEYEFDLPEYIVEKELDLIIEQEIKNFSPAELKELDNKKLQEIREKFRDEAKERVKLTFLIDEIAKKEKIEISDREISEVIVLEAIVNKQDPKELLKAIEEKNLLPVLKMSLLEEKVLITLLDNKLKGQE